MDAKELTDKKATATPTATSGSKIIPKEESEYDKMIREKQEALMEGCCDGTGYRPKYDYSARRQTADGSQQQKTEVQEHVPETDKKNSKR